MPVYTYRCESCGVQFDQHQSYDEDPLVICPECREKSLQKLIQPVGIVFKGSGFYVTDNRKAANSASTGNGKPEHKAEGTSELKPESKSEDSPKAATADDSSSS